MREPDGPGTNKLSKIEGERFDWDVPFRILRSKTPRIRVRLLAKYYSLTADIARKSVVGQERTSCVTGITAVHIQKNGYSMKHDLYISPLFLKSITHPSLINVAHLYGYFAQI